MPMVSTCDAGRAEDRKRAPKACCSTVQRAGHAASARHGPASRSRAAETITARSQFVLRGRLNKQIADDLGIVERTVKVHRKAIMTKLGVRSVAALVQLTQEAGLPMPPEAPFP
jgi:FixJ family two-component response regulator